MYDTSEEFVRLHEKVDLELENSCIIIHSTLMQLLIFARIDLARSQVPKMEAQLKRTSCNPFVKCELIQNDHRLRQSLFWYFQHYSIIYTGEPAYSYLVCSSFLATAELRLALFIYIFLVFYPSFNGLLK